ncbi:DUF6434 domain-containing protein [Cognatiyoonia sp. IB215446]|uniref:DUF6434 domain-containing protein n=1 Tax=Cognatiyoonia sp. IB215446 TaxID=3097355 RepID=UPI002A0ACC18|nr:DUF6434 domain-containing protein [Cognatiyoonia sp. IB215446]MDX8349515.1 DUF6434 domain-containing protein [Cognatiyoonia sp. IB215446]
MAQRPEIDLCPDSETFRRWYYLKAELVAYAREHGLKTSGGKFEIADRIAYYLDHGEPPEERKRTAAASKFDWHQAELTPETVITDSYKNGQNMRRFMQSHISGFKFSIPFMDWMKANVGLTLADAVEAARQIDAAKKAGVKQPDQPHNQYNAYTRAYFSQVPGGTQAELRKLWALRRKQPGPYVFDIADMALLSEK